jgi:hypothetical protein
VARGIGGRSLACNDLCACNPAGSADDRRHEHPPARFLGRSPDQAEPEDLRRYQLHLAGQGASPGKMNLAVSALRFFFKVTLCRARI